MKPIKRALVLSGGGAKGAYEAGAILGLLERRAELGDFGGWDAFLGVSVGAINATWMAQAEDQLAESLRLIKLWENLRQDDVATRSWAGALGLLWNPSLEDTAPLRCTVDELLGQVIHPLAIFAVDLCSGETHAWTGDASREELLEGIMASAAAPILYPPVRRVGPLALPENAGEASPSRVAVYSDGGLADVTPLGAAIAMGAEVIDVVLVESRKLPPWDPEPDRVWNVAPRQLQVMLQTIVEDDLKVCGLYNELARAGVRADKREVVVNLVRPVEPLAVDSAKFVPADSKIAIARGRQDALAFEPFVL